MSLSIDELKIMFEEYVVENYQNEFLEIMKSKDIERHYGIEISFVLLFEKNVELGHGLLCNAVTLLPQLDYTLILAQRKILSSIAENQDELGPRFIVKTNVHVRMTSLPICPELHRTSFPRNRDIGSLLKVSGTVTRISAPKMLEFRREYSCSKCKKVFVIQAEYETYYSLKTPTKCPNVNGCCGTNFTPIKGIDQRNYKDYQEIKIQEQVNKLNVGTVPQSLWATLEDDLVDGCKPGDDVALCGTVMRRWKNDSPGRKHDIELYFRVCHVFVSNDQKSYVNVTSELVSQFESFWNEHKSDELAARDLIVASICPQVYGLYLIKLAVAVILAGGVGKQQETGECRLRGESHLLLVGDPGTAKSHIIRFATKICSRSVHTTGIGSTSAGLTVTAVHERGEWQLEAGALVLADGGICCIDEFNSIREHDRAAIHEAMEQQTISVAKAGVVCKLNTRCSIIAATNPKGHYDSEIPLSVNVSVASPLLSRFDLVFILLDSKNPTWDEIVSRFILDGKDERTAVGSTSLWGVDKLHEYFSVIKNLNPRLTDEANMVLQRYYQVHRQANHGHMARTTVRLLESLIRLSEGHARLMFRQEALVQDAIVAISLMESSILSTSFFGQVDILHTTFPTSPTAEYLKQGRIVLEKLCITDIELQGQSQIQNNHPLSAIRTQSVAGSSNENGGRGAMASSTAEKLSEILCNIRKTKEKTALDAMVQQRTIRKKKRIKRPVNIDSGSDSADDFSPVIKEGGKRSINSGCGEMVETVNEMDLSARSNRAINQLVDSDLQKQDEDSVTLEDNDDDSLPLFGQFINVRVQQSQPNSAGDNAQNSFLSTCVDDRLNAFHAQNSNPVNAERQQLTDSSSLRDNRNIVLSQVVNPACIDNYNSSRVGYNTSRISQSVDSVCSTSIVHDVSNASRSSEHSAVEACKESNFIGKKKKILLSTMNKLKMFAVSSTQVSETASTSGIANDVLSSGSNETKGQMITTESFINGSDAALQSANSNNNNNNNGCRIIAHTEASTSESAFTPAFTSGGHVASLSLFTVDHADLSILDDI